MHMGTLRGDAYDHGPHVSDRPVVAGTIEAEDLWVVMRALGTEPRKEDIKKLVGEVDREGTGQIDFNGYLQARFRTPCRRWPSGAAFGQWTAVGRSRRLC